MKKIALLVLSFFIISCQKDVDFLYRQPEPPPAPEKTQPPQIMHHAKDYSLDVAYTNIVSSKVDILWVIDNSGSMDSHQQDVINNTDLFMQNFTSQSLLEWKMGLISTDQSDQPYVGFGTSVLDSKTPNPVPVFQNAVGKLGTGGSSTEQTYEPVLKALKEHPDFLRPDAFLALIIVTDEDEQSRIGTQQFLDQIKALKGGDAAKFLVFGAFGNTEVCPSGFGGGGFEFKRSRYEELMKATNSTQFVLCAPDFGKVLADLGSNLVEKITVLNPTIALEYRPVVKTIKVTYQGKVLNPGPKSMGGDWTYDPVYNLLRINDPSILNANQKSIQIEFDIDQDFYKN